MQRHLFYTLIVNPSISIDTNKKTSERLSHNAGLINFLDRELNIHNALEHFNSVSMEAILSVPQLSMFDGYIVEYFLTESKPTTEFSTS